MKKNQKKLIQYSALATAFIATSQDSDAQVVYTDLDPDVMVTSTGTIDMDNNLSPDFTVTFMHTSSATVSMDYFGVSGVGGNGVAYFNSTFTFLGSTLSASIVEKLNSGDLVNSSRSFDSAYFCYDGTVLGFPIAVGVWAGSTNKFMGVKFNISGSDHYGWVRLSVASDCKTVTIHDYAYEATAGTGIMAGDTGVVVISAGEALNPMTADVGDAINGTDMQVSFDKAVDETTVAEYRIIIVKSTDAATFNLAAAEAVAAGNYTSISPVGMNISTILAPSAKDKDGDLIIEGQPYKAFILSMKAGTATVNKLSVASNETTLTHVSGLTNISAATDINLYSFGKSIHLHHKGKREVSKVEVYNSIGELVKVIDQVELSNSWELNVASGPYYVIVHAGEEVFSQKLILN